MQQMSGLKQSKQVAGIMDAWYNFEKKDVIPGKRLVDKERTFKNVIKIFNTLLLKTIIETGQTIQLPKRTGFLGLRKFKSGRNAPIDFDHLRKTGEILRWSNPHTDFQHAAFFYERPYGTVSTPALFKFNPVKHARKQLAKALHDNPDLINNYQ